jgi:hypothetical protein
MVEMTVPRAPQLSVLGKTARMRQRTAAMAGTPRLSGVSAGFGGGAGDAGRGGGALTAFDRNNDPIVTGDFERNPNQGGLLRNLISGAGQLSEHGKEQQADHARFLQGQKLMAEAKSQGATDAQALQHVEASDPGYIMNILATHPQALQAFQSASSLYDLMNGKAPAPAYGKFDEKTGQQPITDPSTGQVTGVNKVQGWQAPEPTKNLQVIQTDRGPMVLDHDAHATPILGPDGQAVGSKPTGKAPPGMVTSEIPGIPDQPSFTNVARTTAESAKTINFLSNVPQAINLMQDIKNKADALGLLKGPLTTEIMGKFFGINGKGGAIEADMNILNSLAPQLQESNYKGSLDAFKQGMATPSMAPTFIRTQLPMMIDRLRQQAQFDVDNLTSLRTKPVDQPLAQSLIGAGVVPLGYQLPQNFAAMDAQNPGSSARWKMQFAPQSLNSQDRAQIYQDAANGKYGPLPDSSVPQGQQVLSPDLQRAHGVLQQRQRQQQSQQQQGTAAAAASAAQQKTQQNPYAPENRVPETPQAPAAQAQPQPGAQAGASGAPPGASTPAATPVAPQGSPASPQAPAAPQGQPSTSGDGTGPAATPKDIDRMQKLRGGAPGPQSEVEVPQETQDAAYVPLGTLGPNTDNSQPAGPTVSAADPYAPTVV